MASQKKNKKPAIKTAPSGLKNPRNNYSASDSYLQLSPVWRFDLIDLDGPWGWFNVESQIKVKDIIKKLNNFETMTWAEIKRNDKAHHHVPIDNITKTAKERLVEMEQDDLEEIFSLRLTGTNRIWGKLEQGIFYIIWWDPDHEVCRSMLKNT